MARGEIPQYEALKRLDRNTGSDLTTIKNETENYNVSVHRCGQLSILRVNGLQEQCHRSQSVHETGAGIFPALLFILVYEDGQELMRKRWSVLVPRFHMFS